MSSLCADNPIKRMWQIFAGAALLVGLAGGACNVCQRNQVACVNSTSFHLCFGTNRPYTEVLYHCQEGFQCTDLNAICVQASAGRPPSCGDTKLCGLCSANRNFLFACQSRTTFQMCYGAYHPTGQIGRCPGGYVCDARSDAICVPESSVSSVTCDVVADSPPPTTSSPPPSPTSPPSSPPSATSSPTSAPPLTPTEMCGRVGRVGLFPTIPRDPYCKRFLFCSFKDGVMTGVENTCPTGTYYHAPMEQCGFSKPPDCP